MYDSNRVAYLSLTTIFLIFKFPTVMIYAFNPNFAGERVYQCKYIMGIVEIVQIILLVDAGENSSKVVLT